MRVPIFAAGSNKGASAVFAGLRDGTLVLEGLSGSRGVLQKGALLWEMPHKGTLAGFLAVLAIFCPAGSMGEVLFPGV